MSANEKPTAVASSASNSTSGLLHQIASQDGASSSAAAARYARQAEKLSHEKVGAADHGDEQGGDVAVEARFVTAQDAVIVTAEGKRLPGPPLEEALKLNRLREEAGGELPFLDGSGSAAEGLEKEKEKEGAEEEGVAEEGREGGGERSPELSPSPEDSRRGGQSPQAALQASALGRLNRSMPPSHTNPLFPPLPLYGPPSLLRDLQCWTFRFMSFWLSLAFLGVIVLGALFTRLPGLFLDVFLRLTLRDPDAAPGRRPFREEELRRAKVRRERARAWVRRRRSRESAGKKRGGGEEAAAASGDADLTAATTTTTTTPHPTTLPRGQDEHGPVGEEAGAGGYGGEDGFAPTEGGPDPIVCDVGYYARRVGLDVEELKVQTEDGFVIDLWHVYDPREYRPLPAERRAERGPEAFDELPPMGSGGMGKREGGGDGGAKPRFPVLLVHGLLQSAGAYCTNDDDSLAFYLCKAGYDVWLGNNRCGFRPTHAVLGYSDPRLWCWNIRQMGVFDLPALATRVLSETGFERLGLVAHSQGTTETLVALAKEQRPELGERLTVFCALAPAAYAGPLIGKMYFKFMRVISPAMFRLMFGIHAFIPLMMTMHRLLPGGAYGFLGYQVFSFLFDWSDRRWDRGLRDRMFQFAPVYVSAESMRWWLGRECFARQKCILATKEEWRAEDREDEVAVVEGEPASDNNSNTATTTNTNHGHQNHQHHHHHRLHHHHHSATAPPRRRPKGSTAWYDSRVPPFALWVAGSDDLVDGQKLLRRFARGREPFVRVVHAKVIPEYEHLDVIWAMDAPDRVFGELREVLWKTAGEDARTFCRVPRGCEDVEAWVDPKGKPGGAGAALMEQQQQEMERADQDGVGAAGGGSGVGAKEMRRRADDDSAQTSSSSGDDGGP